MRKYLLIVAAMVFLSGCNEGGGSGGSVSSGFAPVSSSSEVSSSAPLLSSYSAPLSSTTETSMPPVVNPEPATMVLFGVGIAGLAAKLAKKKRG